MLVLLIAAICKTHSKESVKLLNRIIAYISHRLRDTEPAITAACYILTSALVLHVIPLMSIPAEATPKEKENYMELHFKHLAQPFLKEANAICDRATKCLTAIVRPVEFDGTTAPPKEVLLAHVQRVKGFYNDLLSQIVARFTLSVYVNFSPSFVLLQSMCMVSQETKTAGDTVLYELFGKQVDTILEAIEDVFKFAPREEWLLRKRAVELLTLILEIFPEHEYIAAHFENIRAIIISARHDPVSVIREAAICATIAFAAIEKNLKGTISSPFKPLTICSISKSFLTGSDGGGGGWSSSKRNFKVEPNATKNINQEKESKEEEKNALETMGTQEHGDESGPPPPSSSTEDDPFEKIGHGDESNAPPQEEDFSTQSKSQIAKSVIALAKKKKNGPKFPKIPNISPPKKATMIKKEDFKFTPPPEIPFEDEEKKVIRKDTTLFFSEFEQERKNKRNPVQMAFQALEMGQFDVAIKVFLLQDDLTLFRHVLTKVEPCMKSLQESTRNALCAAFLELLEHPTDALLVYPWLLDLSTEKKFVQRIDPRILNQMETLLLDLSSIPTKQGLMAAKVLHFLEF
jgi:hypothetical protein